MLFRGCGEESHPSSSIYVVSSHQVYQANRARIPAPNTVRRPTIAHMQLISYYSLTGKNDSQANSNSPKRNSNHNHHIRQTAVHPGQLRKHKTLTQSLTGKETTYSQPVHEGNLHLTPKHKGKIYACPQIGKGDPSNTTSSRKREWYLHSKSWMKEHSSQLAE